MRSLQSTIGHNDHASVDFRFGLRTQKDCRFTRWCPIASDGVRFHPGGPLQVVLCHTYQFFNFEQAGRHTAGVYQNDMLVREKVYKCFKYKGSRPGEMNFVQAATSINWDMDSSCNFLERPQIAASRE